MSERRHGLPYIWVTWLAKLLGGNQCVWSAWFKAHFKYEKFQEQAMDLSKWNAEHNRMMAARKLELEEDGWTVSTESQNAFKLQGQTAVVAGKPDIVATKGGQVLVVDGKTGAPRDADIWQVLFYLFAVPKSRVDLKGDLVGEVHYKRGEERVTLTPLDLDESRMSSIVALIRDVSSDTPPAKVPSREECKRCDIGFRDCPQRIGVQQERATAVGEW